jgi:hypothetical protein
LLYLSRFLNNPVNSSISTHAHSGLSGSITLQIASIVQSFSINCLSLGFLSSAMSSCSML